MNISDSLKKLGTGVEKPVLEKSNTSKGSDKTTAATGNATTDTDSVTLSSASVQLQSIGASSASGEVFDANKVEEIKSAIARGEFTVDTGKVADGLLQTVKDLIQPNKG
jgi:negative regulator of flagellin synthesis FlgM